MSLVNEEIIPATTSAVASDKFNVKGTKSLASGVLGSGEYVRLEYTHNGSDWQTLQLNGVIQQIDANHSTLTIKGPGSFRCVKSATAISTSVNLWVTEAER